MRPLFSNKVYNTYRFCSLAYEPGATRVILGDRNCKHTIRYDKQRYRGRHGVENAFCGLDVMAWTAPAPA